MSSKQVHKPRLQQYEFGCTKTCPNTGRVSHHVLYATAASVEVARAGVESAWGVVAGEALCSRPAHYFMAEVNCA